MVNSKARCHFKQYMKSKPTKWGFKVCVLANMKGYTFDFNIHTGKSTEKSDSGLSHDVIMQHGIMATGTFHTSRQGLPSEAVSLKDAFIKGKLPQGTGYYTQDSQTDIVYCMWKDTCVVSVMSTVTHQATKVRIWYPGIALVQLVSKQS